MTEENKQVRVLGARCQLIEEIGTGASGAVYRAFDSVLGRVVAAKVMQDRTATTVQAFAQRARETRGGFDHPNLVTTFDVFRDRDATVLLSDFYEFGSLEATLANSHAVVARWTAVMVADVLAGLQALHTEGLIHGDLHLGNILVADAGDEGLRFAISDFGSTAGGGGRARGAASTLPPELWAGKAPDERSDLFAVGIVARSCLAGLAEGSNLSGMTNVIELLVAHTPADRPESADVALGLVQGLGPARPTNPARPALICPPLPAGWKPSVGRLPRRSIAAGPSHPLVGRERELARLDASWRRSVAGEGSTVVLLGDAGTGKTRLAAELAARIDDAIVLRGRAIDTGPTFEIWRSLIIHSVDELGVEAVVARLGVRAAVLAIYDSRLGRAPTVGATPEEVQAALDALLRAAAQENPTLVLIDDAHYAAPDDFETLANLARSLGDARVLMVVNARPRDDLLRTVGDDAEILTISDLTDEAMARLVASLTATDDPEQLATITQRSGGNAYYAVELARAFSSDPTAGVPDTVAEAVLSRVADLGSEIHRFLEVAAMVGPEPELEVVTATIDIPVEAARLFVETCTSARVVVAVDDIGARIRFTHDLTREILAAAIPIDEQLHLHRRIARVSAEYAPGDPALLTSAAEHLIATEDPGDRPEAGRLFKLAWEQARANDSIDIAEAAGIAAFDLARNAGETDTAALGLDVGSLAERRGHYDLAIRVFREAREGTDNELTRVELDRRRAYALEKSGDYDQSLAVYRCARTALDAIGSESEHASLRAEVTLGCAVTEFYRGNFHESRALSVDGLARAESCHNDRLVAQACLQLEMVSSELDLPDREAWSQRALELLRRLDDPVGLGNLLLNLGVSRYNDGEWSDALGMYRDAISSFDCAHDVIGAAIARNNEAEVLTGQGRLRDARWRLVEAQRVFTTTGSTGYPMGEALATSGLSRVMLHSGRPDEAERLLSRALDLFRALDATNFVYDTRVREVELCVYTNALDRAESVATEARELEAIVGDVAILPITLTRLVASVAWTRGDRKAAAEQLAVAESEARRARAASELALVLDAFIGMGIRTDDATRRELVALNDALGVVWLPPVPSTAA